MACYQRIIRRPGWAQSTSCSAGHSLVTAMLLMLHSLRYKKPLTKLKGVLGAGRLDLVVFAISSDS
ncbi:hypothetical protein ACP70R_040680 [Stipagrostis hirtigluma subsp. patula]